MTAWRIVVEAARNAETSLEIAREVFLGRRWGATYQIRSKRLSGMKDPKAVILHMNLVLTSFFEICFKRIRKVYIIVNDQYPFP